MSSSMSIDPFMVLGVSKDADEVEIRARYLELVKQFPPDREPDKFREIRAAFDVVKDPTSIAKRLISPPSEEIPDWSDVLKEQKQNPPRLSVAFLLSFGNCAAGETVTSIHSNPGVEDLKSEPSLGNKADAP